MNYKKGKELFEDDMLKMDGQKVLVIDVENNNLEIHTIKLNHKDIEEGQIVSRNVLMDISGAYWFMENDKSVKQVFEYIKDGALI